MNLGLHDRFREARKLSVTAAGSRDLMAWLGSAAFKLCDLRLFSLQFCFFTCQMHMKALCEPQDPREDLEIMVTCVLMT